MVKSAVRTYRKKRPQLADSAEDLLQLPAAGPEGRTGVEERVLDGVVEVEIADALLSLSQAFARSSSSSMSKG